jgi:diguanylate cyclase (GGDEF)-like protein
LEQLHRINSALGDASGDLLLQAVAERLHKRIGMLDTVAHLGAAQFAILLTTTHDRNEVAQIAETILDAFSLPFLAGTHEVFLTAQIGIAFFGHDGCDLDTLIKHANAAREDAKKPGNQPYQFYITSIGAKSQEALLLELELHQALEREEFQLYYQPKVNPQTGQIQGAEALVRWYHPTRGSVSPAEFVPMAEKTGFIVPLGEWVLKTACAQAKVWQDAGYPLRIAVNLSGHQFNQPNLNTLVVNTLKETELDPRYLELEITESALMQNPEAAIAILSEFKAIGIQISIDDFGTGYSSLSYLRQFPFDILKIDRSFVCQLTKDDKNVAITTAILQMARSLNLKVVAEGVETASQLAFLDSHECDEIQGYWFSPPLSAETLEELLSAGKSLPLLSC